MSRKYLNQRQTKLGMVLKPSLDLWHFLTFFMENRQIHKSFYTQLPFPRLAFENMAQISGTKAMINKTQICKLLSYPKNVFKQTMSQKLVTRFKGKHRELHVNLKVNHQLQVGGLFRSTTIKKMIFTSLDFRLILDFSFQLKIKTKTKPQRMEFQ